jgi:FkbH-like protein
MNLTTRRLTKQEFNEWSAAPGRHVLALRVSDRFGDSGLTGIVSCELDGENCRVVDFVLSCRVFGRQIERLMVHEIVDFARQNGAAMVAAQYLETRKNNPCFDFWTGSGFEFEAGGETFTWNCEAPYEAPACIDVQRVTVSSRES